MNPAYHPKRDFDDDAYLYAFPWGDLALLFLVIGVGITVVMCIAAAYDESVRRADECSTLRVECVAVPNGAAMVIGAACSVAAQAK